MSDDIPEPDRVEGSLHPRHTTDVIGQSKAQTTFLEAYNQGRLHHAWLISGVRGVGKATLAWKIARFLLAQPVAGGGMFADEPTTAENLSIPADSPIMRRTSALAEPRLFLCRRPFDEKAKRLKKDITVDEVRKLKSFFNLSAADGGRRVVILDAADEMNTSAANALLKLLEEPPENCVLLLIAHRPQKLLPTIRSRCRMLKCSRLSPEHLAQVISATEYDVSGDYGFLADLSDGSAGEAIRLLSHDGLSLYSQLVNLTKTAPRMDRNLMLSIANACVGKGNEARYELTLRLLAILLHRLAKSGIDSESAQGATRADISALAKLCRDQSQARKWASLAQELEARAAHGRAVNLDPATVILDMLIKIDQTAGRLAPA